MKKENKQLIIPFYNKLKKVRKETLSKKDWNANNVKLSDKQPKNSLVQSKLNEDNRDYNLTIPDSTNSDYKYTRRFYRVIITLGVLLSISTAIYYWDELTDNIDNVFLYIWTFLFMVLGTILKNAYDNNSSRNNPFDIPYNQLIQPLFFSFITYHPIYIALENTVSIYILLYTAITNGFVWEAVLSKFRNNSANLQ